jgi:hypothetical protein
MPRRVRLCKGVGDVCAVGRGNKYLVAGASVSVCDVLACTSESRRALKIYHPSHTHPVGYSAHTHAEMLYARAKRMRDDRGSRLGRGRG